MLNKKIGIFLLFFVLIGCASLSDKNQGLIGKETKKINKITNQIQDNNQQLAYLNEGRLTSIGAWSSGVDYSLQKEEAPSPAVDIAKEFNQRVVALANKPDFEEVQALYDLVNTLLTNKIAGEKLLKNKDEKIELLYKSIHTIELEKDKRIEEAIKQACASSSKADQYKSTLGTMDSFWGGGAIWYGVKKMAIRLMWVIGGGLIIYIGLRIAAVFSPIAATLFSVVNIVFSVFIRAIQGIAPKAAQTAGYIETKIFNGYKQTLTKVVDAIQMLKAKERMGIDITMDALMQELTSLDAEDRSRIEKIKQELNWK